MIVKISNKMLRYSEFPTFFLGKEISLVEWNEDRNRLKLTTLPERTSYTLFFNLKNKTFDDQFPSTHWSSFFLLKTPQNVENNIQFILKHTIEVSPD